MITTFIITIVSILIGYFLGKGSISKDTYQEIKKQVEHRVLPKYTQPSGPIQRPDAKRLYDLEHPEVEEEKEEMRKVMQEGIKPLTP
jgi:hypothetical protein